MDIILSHGAIQYSLSYAKDAVAIMVDNNSAGCGRGWCNNVPTVDFMFSLTKWSCAIGNLSFAHEIGHNMVRAFYQQY